MSEIFDALLRAQREVQSQRRGAEGEAPATPSPNGQPAVVETHHAPAPARRRWHHWLSGNGHSNGKPVDSSQWSLLINPDGSGELAEPFRHLRSTLLGLEGGMIMVSSALDEEGKTLCAANLAISLSLASTRDVILVDLDLRRPSVASRLRLHRGPGIVDCLVGEAQWRNCLQPTAYPHLKVLSAGTHSRGAPELIASEALRRLLSDMRAHAQNHFVLFDTPPVLLTSDPQTVVDQMEHIVLVVRAGSTPKAALVKAVESLGSEKMLGVVFNQATIQASDYYRYGSRSPYYGDYNRRDEPSK